MCCRLPFFDPAQDCTGHRIGTKSGTTFQSLIVGKLIQLTECSVSIIHWHVDGLGNGLVHMRLNGRLHGQVRGGRKPIGINERWRQSGGIARSTPACHRIIDYLILRITSIRFQYPPREFAVEHRLQTA